MAEHRYAAVVIGTGFGGAITACRLARKWPGGKVLVLERGKRYPMGSFPRKPHDMAQNFWNVPKEARKRPAAVEEQGETHGLFDIRNYKKMDAVLCAGYGGGSLIYANVFLEPPEAIFHDDRWPGSCKKEHLEPYYGVAKEVLGSRPVPQTDDPRRRILRTEMFQKVAKAEGRDSRLLDINVFFGNDFQNPLPIGQQDRNRYGAIQTSCVYCAECDVGCNTHSKNTLDLNYLFVAEHRHGAEVRTQHLVERIVPLGADGQDAPSADGAHGYRVVFRDLLSREERSVTTDRVVVSAGTFGSNELLLRCRDVFRTLPGLSKRLGHDFSGNGDFLSFVLGTEEAADPNYGPVITQATDWNLFRDFDRERAFLVEDASYPVFLSWFVEGVKPGYLRLGAIYYTLKQAVVRFLTGQSPGSVGWALGDLLRGDISWTTAVLLCMGIDTSTGTLKLDRDGYVDLSWPQKDNRKLYDAILEAGKRFKDETGGDKFFPLPTWWWPMRNNVTVHALGGCVLADDAAKGVTNADRARFGEAFGHRNLYVADGAIVPTAVGANPTATISALSEMVAEGITGERPTADL